MRTITTWADLKSAIITERAGTHLSAHHDRLIEFNDRPLSELCVFVIVEPTDRLDDLQTRLNRPLHPPPWEYAELTNGWFELVLITGDDGFGFVVLVEDHPGNDGELLAYCRAMIT